MSGQDNILAERSGISRRWQAIAVLIVLLIGGYYLATDYTVGLGKGTGTTAGQSNTQTSSSQTTYQTGVVTTNTIGQQTVNMLSYDWTDPSNLTVTLSDNGSIPLVIHNINVGGTVAKSVNTSTPAAGSCTPTGSSYPYKLPAACDPGQLITLYISPPNAQYDFGGVSCCEVIVSQGNTAGFVVVNAIYGWSSAQGTFTQTQTTYSSTIPKGGQQGPLGPGGRTYIPLATLDAGKYVELLLNSTGTVDVIMHNSTGSVFSTSGVTGNFTLCVPATSSNYNVELYNPDVYYNAPTVTVSLNAYEFADSSCMP